MSEKKEVCIAADHRGYELKEYLKGWLTNEGYEVCDFGAHSYDESDDYPDYAFALAESVAKDPEKKFGIVICGSGVGMAVAADKVKGIRAGFVHDPEIAAVARADDDINVIALGADYIEENDAKEVVQAWLSSQFSGESRHRRRLDKIEAYEAN